MHGLDGPRARIERAKSQLAALQETSRGFFERYPYRVAVAEFDKKAGYHNLRVRDGPVAFPDEWGVIIGEIAHNLRSALDGLAWQLALLKNRTPAPNTQFPIFLRGTTTRRRSPRRGKGKAPLVPHFKKQGRDMLTDLGPKHQTRIESFQPYKRGNGGRNSPLFLLQELNNSDKHRLVTVLATVMGGYVFSGLVGGGSNFKVGAPLQPNAKVGSVLPLPMGGVRVLDIENGRIRTQNGKIRTRTEHEPQVDFRATPEIRFAKGCDAVQGLPATGTLRRIVDEVSRVVESFAGEF